MRVTNAAAEVNVSPKIGVDWYNFFRDICVEHFLANPIATRYKNIENVML